MKYILVVFINIVIAILPIISNADDSDDVRKVYMDYVNAIKTKNGEIAWTLLDLESKMHYTKLAEIAVKYNKYGLISERPSIFNDILLLRINYNLADLAKMNGNKLYIKTVEDKLSLGSVFLEYKIKEVVVNKSDAYIMYDNKMYTKLTKVNYIWKVSLSNILVIRDAAIKELAKRNKITEYDVIINNFSELYNNELIDKIQCSPLSP